MASVEGNHHHILIKSKFLLIKAWARKENGKLFKITGKGNWKNVLPGDFVALSFDFETGFCGYNNLRKPEINATVYRNNEVLFTEKMYFTYISSMLSHFEIEQIDNM